MADQDTIEMSENEVLRLQADLKTARTDRNLDDEQDALHSLFILHGLRDEWAVARTYAVELEKTCTNDTLFEPLEAKAMVLHAALMDDSDLRSRDLAVEQAKALLVKLKALPEGEETPFQVATLETALRVVKSRTGQSEPAEQEVLDLLADSESDPKLAGYYRALVRPIFMQGLVRIARERPDPVRVTVYQEQFAVAEKLRDELFGSSGPGEPGAALTRTEITGSGQSMGSRIAFFLLWMLFVFLYVFVLWWRKG